MASRKTPVVRILYLSIAVNVVLAGIKTAAGYYGDSFALIADGIESTGDIFSSLLILLGVQYARRPADQNHPYGHGKAEPLVTFIVVGFLVMSASFIAYESINNILEPHPSPQPYTLIVLGLVMVTKEIFFRFMNRQSKHSHSSALKADAWHHRSDAITSLAAFAGISISLFFGEGFQQADDWAALVAAGVIIYNSYLIFRPALGEIMDEDMHEELIAAIRQTAGEVKGVLDTEKCFIRKSGTHYFVDLHTSVDGNISVKEGHEIAHRLKSALIAELPQIKDVLIHIEPSPEN